MVKEKEYCNIIRKLGLKAIQSLTGASCKVYKVKDIQGYKVIKFSDDLWTFDHVSKENKMLEMAKEIDGITHKIKFYDTYKLRQLGLTEDTVALLKEYIQGEAMDDINTKNYPSLKPIITGSENQKSLELTVKALHELGIANLDLVPRNVVISASMKPYIIDLGLAILKEDSEKRFIEGKENDLECLESLLRYPNVTKPRPICESD